MLTPFRRGGVLCQRTRPAPMERLARLLVTPDAHLITLKDGFVGYVLPSKVYGCLASARPILFVGAAASDVHLLCAHERDERSYRRVSVGDADGVFRVLEEWAMRSQTVGVA